MNAFDRTILTFLNQLAHRSWFLDKTLHSLAGNDLLKGGLAVSILWGLWFRRDELTQEEATRKTIIAVFVGAIAATISARLLAQILPFRPRPMHDAALSFVLPFGVAPEELLDNAMAFPSDHAVLLFGLAAGIFLLAHRLGLLVFAYLFIEVFLLRVYLGYHHPTDVIAGALIGIVFVALANGSFCRRHVVDRIYPLSVTSPGTFYAASFFATYQMATLFAGSRALAGTAFKLLQGIAASSGLSHVF